MTKIQRRFKQLFQDPILARIVFLSISTAIIIIAAVGSELFIHRITQKQAELVTNERTHWVMGKIIIRKLLLVQQDLNNLITAKDSRKIATYQHVIHAELSRIQKILGLFRTGGSFIDIMPANMPQKHKLAEIHEYTPPGQRGYIIEELELMPQIIQIKTNINDIMHLAMIKVSPGKTPDQRSKASTKIEHLSDITRTLIKRARTNSSRIYFDSLKNITNAQKKTHHNILRWNRIRFVFISLLLATGLTILLKTIRQIAKIINQNRQYSESLAQTTSTLEQIIESLPVGVIIVEKGFAIRHINAAAAQMLEISNPDSLKGVKCTQVFCSADKQHCPFVSKDIIGKPKEIQVKCATGNDLPVIKNSMLAQIGDDKVMLETFINITDRKNTEILQTQYQKHLEAEVNKRTQDLQTLTEKLIEEKQNALHENINTRHQLLSNAVIEQIQLQLSLMQEKSPLQPLQNIRNLCNAYACLQENKNGEMKQPVDLNAMIAQVVTIAQSIWSSDAKIEFKQTTANYRVMGIYHDLAQAFMDIIERAIQAHKTAPADNAFVNITLNSDNGFCKTIIHDNAPSIAKDKQDNILNTKNSKLFYAYETIEKKHSGRLMFSSKTDTGTSFQIKLPVLTQ